MSFLYPLFLIAGLSLAVPILIHLFNFRKYKKSFSRTFVFAGTTGTNQKTVETQASSYSIGPPGALILLGFSICPTLFREGS
ncbi:MAG: BatA domain-containing protein [Bacteroidota bacterium]|nr:MAG: BatA domain-containing protein [Bacteroidota bacterium]